MLSIFKKNKAIQNQVTIADEAFFAALRAKEYSRLDHEQHVYLDYTGGNLAAATQIEQHCQLLHNSVLGNPHSTNPTSQKATHLVEAAREKVLSFFNAHDYVCIFTANASAALKIVGESYPFSEQSSFVILADNHNSVNGIREYCNQKGGSTQYVPVQFEDLQINEALLSQALEAHSHKVHKLFALPAQSNVSGVKHDLQWVKKAQAKGYDVLLDAAAFVPSSRLDLSIVQADFVSVSFYKIFGYPTGLGCLLIKKSKFDLLKKPWFAGGTVSYVATVRQDHFLANAHERFEDGTLNYAGIPAIQIGLSYIESIGIDRINARVKALIEALANGLKALRHDNGLAIVKIFGPDDFSNRGGNIIMNFFDVSGNKFSLESIESLCNKNMISIRSGCFCNPGIDEINSCISNEEAAKYFTSRDFGDYKDIMNFFGNIRGAIRASVGIATTAADIQKLIQLIKQLQNKTIAQA